MYKYSVKNYLVLFVLITKTFFNINVNLRTDNNRHQQKQQHVNNYTK